MRNAIIDEITKRTKEDSNLLLVVGDCGFGLIDNYKKQFPKQFLNAGINEAASIGLCAGYTLVGKRSIYYNIAPFSIMRPFEQVRLDICYQECPVVLIGIGCGLTYAPGGATHYGVDDISIALSMPNLQIFSPCSANESRACFNYAYDSKKPSYIRITKAAKQEFAISSQIDVTKPQIYKEGKEILLLTHSEIITEVIKAASSLEGATIATIPMINAKSNELEELLRVHKHIFVIEEHFEYGGLGSFLRDNFQVNIHKIALPNAYIHKVGTQAYLREFYSIDSSGILSKIQQTLKETL